MIRSEPKSAFSSKTLSTSMPTNMSPLLQHKIVGEFDLENSHFVVICSEKHQFEKTRVASSFLNRDSLCSVAGCIEVNEQACTIVKINNRIRNPEANSVNNLTKREVQVAALVALGWSNKQIASRLEIRECTVSTYLRRIFMKLDVDSRAAMVYQCASLIDLWHQESNSLNSMHI